MAPSELDTFESIYLKEFGEQLSVEDLEHKARIVLNLYIAVYRSVLDVIKEETLT